MMNYPMSEPTIRLLLPETLWLEPEHYEQAREISRFKNDERQQWQTYLNVLGQLAFAAWLTEQFPDDPIHPSSNEATEVSALSVGAFKLCLISTEHILDEVVRVPRTAIEQPDLAAHFYVVLEVLEDQEQVMIRGFLRHDELVTCDRSIVTTQPDEFCRFSLTAFDAEINHLVFYVQQVEPSAIPLPAASAQPIAAPLQSDFSPIRTRLSQWLQGVLDQGWQTVDALVNPAANLAWSTRHTPLSAKGGKLINFGMQLGSQAVVLLVTVIPESEGKIGVNVQVLPAAGAQILPAQVKLTLLSNQGKTRQEVQSREHDHLIQLNPFKGRPGTGFNIEVSLNEIRVREAFEL